MHTNHKHCDKRVSRGLNIMCDSLFAITLGFHVKRLFSCRLQFIKRSMIRFFACDKIDTFA